MKELQTTDPDRVKAYLDALDRLFLQMLVHRFLSKEEIQSMVEHWQSQIKDDINFESGARTEFLMDTQIGRIMSSSEEEVEDGETLRLNSTNAMKLAYGIVRFNLTRDE